MPSKRQQRTQGQRNSQHFGFGDGALSLDKGPLAPPQPPPPPAPLPAHAHLAPPDLDPTFAAFGGGFSSSSSAASSVIGTPQPRSESPDLALLGTSLPPPPPAPPQEPLSTQQSSPVMTSLGDRTFNAKAEMPKWMQEVTGGFAKEVSQLMQEMEELRRQKQALQLEIANLMGTLSQYSPGGQFAPHWGPSVTPEPPASESESIPEPGPGAVVPAGPAKPGWRTVRPQPKKIRSTVVPAGASKTAAPKGHHLATLRAPSPVRSPLPEPPKRPSWSTWQPGNPRHLPMKPPAPAPPPTVPTLFGE